MDVVTQVSDVTEHMDQQMDEFWTGMALADDEGENAAAGSHGQLPVSNPSAPILERPSDPPRDVQQDWGDFDFDDSDSVVRTQPRSIQFVMNTSECILRCLLTAGCFSPCCHQPSRWVHIELTAECIINLAQTSETVFRITQSRNILIEILSSARRALSAGEST